MLVKINSQYNNPSWVRYVIRLVSEYRLVTIIIIIVTIKPSANWYTKLEHDTPLFVGYRIYSDDRV